MKTTPLAAAIKRLDESTRWHQYDHSVPISRAKLDNPYARNPKNSHIEDVALVLRALDQLDMAAHVDDCESCPVFEIVPECLWTNASGRKGLLHCIGVALVNGDAKEGNHFR